MDETPMHIAYEEAKKDALEIGIPVTGSEVVGLVPLEALLGTYLQKLQVFNGVSNLETRIDYFVFLGRSCENLDLFLPKQLHFSSVYVISDKWVKIQFFSTTL